MEALATGMDGWHRDSGWDGLGMDSMGSDNDNTVKQTQEQAQAQTLPQDFPGRAEDSWRLHNVAKKVIVSGVYFNWF